MHWEPDPAALLYLQMLWDWNLRCDSEMVKALVEQGGYGNHGGKSNGTVAERGDQPVSGSDRHSTDTDAASDKGQH
jgi:hypothetical protein